VGKAILKQKKEKSNPLLGYTWGGEDAASAKRPWNSSQRGSNKLFMKPKNAKDLLIGVAKGWGGGIERVTSFTGEIWPKKGATTRTKGPKIPHAKLRADSSQANDEFEPSLVEGGSCSLRRLEREKKKQNAKKKGGKTWDGCRSDTINKETEEHTSKEAREWQCSPKVAEVNHMGGKGGETIQSSKGSSSKNAREQRRPESPSAPDNRDSKKK